MSDNVIFLDFRSPNVEEDERSLLACKTCRNKTYKLVYDAPKAFPVLQCCACETDLGRMGWWNDA